MSKKKLPKFKTEEEFIEFAETHDLGEYWDEFEEVKEVKIDLRRQIKKGVPRKTVRAATKASRPSRPASPRMRL